MIKMSIEVKKVENDYVIEVDKYTASAQVYVASTAEQATRTVGAALTANEENEKAESITVEGKVTD